MTCPHALCTAALPAWKPDAADVSPMAGHASVCTTVLMHADTTAGVLDRAVRQPTSHHVRGLPPRAPRRGKARPRATERGNTDE